MQVLLSPLHQRDPNGGVLPHQLRHVGQFLEEALQEHWVVAEGQLFISHLLSQLFLSPTQPWPLPGNNMFGLRMPAPLVFQLDQNLSSFWLFFFFFPSITWSRGQERITLTVRVCRAEFGSSYLFISYTAQSPLIL